MIRTKEDSIPAWELDRDREETKVLKAQKVEDGWWITREDGWSLFFAEEHGVVPNVGDELVVWGGIGRRIRGVKIAGKLAFYRTPEEDRIKNEQDTYGVDAADWLKRWDSGDTVHTITLGGLSAGYDQCINIVVAETVREMLNLELDGAMTPGQKQELEKRLNETLKELGLSGAQYGAGLHFGVQLVTKGPIAALAMYPDDRHTMASKRWPVLGLSRDDMSLAARALEAFGAVQMEGLGKECSRIAHRLREFARTGG